MLQMPFKIARRQGKSGDWSLSKALDECASQLEGIAVALEDRLRDPAA